MENEKTLNVYAKLSVLRASVHTTVLRKKGKGYGYSYFELADFMPPAIEKMAEIGLASTFNIVAGRQIVDENGVTTVVPDKAVLKIINTDDSNDLVEFESPVASMSMKGGNAIQAIGSQNTYFRRYLWMNALEICEHDEVDSVDGHVPVEEAAEPVKKAKVSHANAATPAKEVTDSKPQAQPKQPNRQIENVADDDLPF